MLFFKKLQWTSTKQLKMTLHLTVDVVVFSFECYVFVSGTMNLYVKFCDGV